MSPREELERQLNMSDEEKSERRRFFSDLFQSEERGQ